MSKQTKIGLAVAVFAVAVLILMGNAFGATDSEQVQEERRLALAAYDQAALERDRPERERMESAAARRERVKAAQVEFGRLCQILPVMTDAGLASCKLAYGL